jgi:rubrerythrin
MSFNFNADEIFQMGVRIEANGQKFYETIARNTLQPSAQNLFLDLAVAFEKDSVVFYTTMKKLVPEHLGKGQIDTLIHEEISHIFILTQKKRELETRS